LGDDTQHRASAGHTEKVSGLSAPSREEQDPHEREAGRQSPKVDLGTVETLLGNLQVNFVVSAEGDAHAQVYADPSGVGKGDVAIMLDVQGYERRKAIVKGADGVIDRMIAEGKIGRMLLPYRVKFPSLSRRASTSTSFTTERLWV